MKNWLPNLFRRKPQRIHVQPVMANEMRLADFRAVAGLVIEAKKIADNPAFQTMVAVLKTESPANFGTPIGMHASDHSKQLGKIEGYQMCLTHLELLSKPPEKSKAFFEATFEPQQEQQSE